MSNNGMSIIVPLLNEEETVSLFCDEYEKLAEKLDFNIEIVFVDDGSTDSTIKKISEYKFEKISCIKIIKLSKNFGAHAAIRAGIKAASFDICTWVGSDLQEPREIIEISYNKIAFDDYDAVYIEKKTVGVSRFERTISKFYSRLMQKYAVSNYSSGGTSTIVFGKKIKEYLNNNLETNSLVMLQIMNAGFKYYSISIDYAERVAGKSKWTLSKKIKLFIDSFVSFSFMPIRIVSTIGILIFFLGIILGIVTIVNRVINPLVPNGYSTLASIMALGFGITNISLGVIAEYLWRTYDAARNRPPYLVADELIIKEE